MRTTYKQRKTISICCMLLVFMLTACSMFFLSPGDKAHAAAPDGIQAAVGGNTKTMYYLKLPTKNLSIGLYDGYAYELASAIFPGYLDWWNNYERVAEAANNRVHTFIFTYNKILVNGKPLMTTWNIECTTDGWGNIFNVGHIIFYPKADVNINIRSEYYELFQNGDFSDVTITYMYAGYGYRMAPADINPATAVYDLSGAQLFQREVSPDYDPIIEEGQAPDNGGIIMDPSLPPVINWFNKILETTDKALKSSIFFILIIVVVVVLSYYFKPKRR